MSEKEFKIDCAGLTVEGGFSSKKEAYDRVSFIKKNMKIEVDDGK